jgi:hypothetical protein
VGEQNEKTEKKAYAYFAEMGRHWVGMVLGHEGWFNTSLALEKR